MQTTQIRKHYEKAYPHFTPPFLIKFNIFILLLLAACTQEEVPGGSNLPEGEYPVLIDAVMPSDTRVTDDGVNTSWSEGDRVGVCVAGMENKTGTYSYSSDGTWVNDGSPLYWPNTRPNQTLNAWYPVDGSGLNLADQTGGLPYVLKGTGQATDITQPVPITFEHQLAKVRLNLSGVKGYENATATMKGYTNFTYNQGTLTPQGSDYGTIQMHRNGNYMEALVIPMSGDIAGFFSITVPGYPQPYRYDLQAANAPAQAGKVYTYDLNLNVPVLSPTQDIRITGDGEYIIQGDGSNTDKTITINGSATVTLKGLNVWTSLPIRIEGGSPTLLVDGENRLESTGKNDGGIILENGTSITIKGKSNQYDGGGNDKLYVSVKEESVGIGPRRLSECGTISIQRLYIDVTAQYSAAIGASQGGTCEKVDIRGSTIYAKGAPGIGAGLANDPNEHSNCKQIYIDECHFKEVSSTTILEYINGQSTRYLYNAAIGCGAAVNGATVTCGDITIRHNGEPSMDNLLRGIKLHDPAGKAYRIGTGTIDSNSSATCGSVTLRWWRGSTTGMVM